MAIDPLTNMLAGGLAGAAGTTVTCPLEVIKTRLQTAMGQNVLKGLQLVSPAAVSSSLVGVETMTAHSLRVVTPMVYLRHILNTEGLCALFKGLTPSLFGIVPTRAIYFTAYSQAKHRFNKLFPYESPAVHLCSAISAGAVTATFTSPIWVVKTQVQLESKPGKRMSVNSCVRQIYKVDGFRGFYRGLTASYAGTMETAIHFVIYEHIKKLIIANNRDTSYQLRPLDCVIAAGSAKLIASTTCYPHEVVRTRMRVKVPRAQRKYHSFFQTLFTVWREEGIRRGLYGGMSAHLMRVVPNTAIVFLTYEAVVSLIDTHS